MSKINKLIEKYGSRKVFIILTTILLVIGIAVSSGINASHKVFYVNGIKFSYVDSENKIWTFIDENNEVLKAYTQNHLGQLDSFFEPLTIEYKGDIITKQIDRDSFETKIYVNDQLIYKSPMITVVVDNASIDQEKEEKELFEVALIDDLVRESNHIHSGEFKYMVLINVLLILFGTSQLVFPVVYWHLKHFLSVEGGEPTDFFITMTQLGGIALIAMGVLVPLIGLK